MDDFYTYVRLVAGRNNEEWTHSEALYMIRTFIAPLLREKADTLIVTDVGMRAIKNGEVDELKRRRQPTGFKETMRALVEHDERVRQHFQLVEELPDSDIYRIVPDNESSIDSFYTYINLVVAKNIFDWHPYSEVLQLILRYIAPLVRKQVDKLTVTDRGIIASKAGEVLEDFEYDLFIGFKETMCALVEHDERVRQHFQLVEESPEADTYRVIPEPTEET